MGEVFISTLGGAPYPDGSSGVHIPRCSLRVGTASTEWVSVAPIIKLSVVGKTATLSVDKKDTRPLQAVASKAATRGGGCIVFFARPGVRMLVRIEGIDSLEDLEQTHAFVPYALFPHQALAAHKACGDAFLTMVERGIVIERHCVYDERDIATTTMPASSGLLTATQQNMYTSTRGLRLGACSCDCNGSTAYARRCDDTVVCELYTVRRIWRNASITNEMMFVQLPSSGELLLFKAADICSTLLYSKKIFEYASGNVLCSCHLAMWRCNRAIGIINQSDLVPMPAEATLVWEYTSLRQPEERLADSYYTTRHVKEEEMPWSLLPLPASDARTYNDSVEFPLFIYTKANDRVTNITEEALRLEYEAYTHVCDAMHTKMYVVSGGAHSALRVSEGGDAAVYSADTVAVRMRASLLEQSTSSERPYAKVDHVLFNADTKLFTLVSSTAPNIFTCVLRVSPLSPLWETLQSRSANAPPVALDAQTLASIDATATWIPSVTQRDVVTAVGAGSPVPFDLLGGGLLLKDAAPTQAPHASGGVLITDSSTTPRHAVTPTLSKEPTLARSENEHSVLFGVAALFCVAFLLFRARKRRRQ